MWKDRFSDCATSYTNLDLLLSLNAGTKTTIIGL